MQQHVPPVVICCAAFVLQLVDELPHKPHVQQLCSARHATFGLPPLPQARAAPLGPVTPEAIAVLEAEVALLQQAIQLCDELPCLTGSRRQGQQQQQAQQPAAEQQAEEAAQGAALQGGPASTATGVQQQQAAGQNGQDEVIVPDTEECGLLPSPPKSASTAAAASSEPVAAGCGAGPQQAQQQHSEQQQQQDEQQEQQSVRSQERKRRLGELRAAQEQERALQAGLTQEMEDEEGHRMSGKACAALVDSGCGFASICRLKSESICLDTPTAAVVSTLPISLQCKLCQSSHGVLLSHAVQGASGARAAWPELRPAAAGLGGPPTLLLRTPTQTLLGQCRSILQCSRRSKQPSRRLSGHSSKQPSRRRGSARRQ